MKHILTFAKHKNAENMLQIAYLRENADKAIAALKVRNIDATDLIKQALDADEKRRKQQAELDNHLAESNKAAKEIGMLFKQGKQNEANALREKTAQMKASIKEMQEQLSAHEKALFDVLTQIPNVPNPQVPSGKSDADNVEVYSSGDLPSKPAPALPHWELASKYNIIDFELGTKITGAGFPVYLGKGARLQRALINFFLEENMKAGYTEVLPPHLVNEESGFGTGQLPDKEGQMYHTPADNFYLIPTAEVPVTNFYRNSIVKNDELPIKLTAYTPCFRREAGSYGKDVRGLNRLHQFDKVEIVRVEKPENSYAVLDEMVEHVKGILNKLELPYRVVRLCGGDLGFTSALTYDFEVWSAAQEKWLEVSSVSNFEAFQANRLKLRYKDENNKTQLCHTLNGSALALPRILAALLENNQFDGGIKIPEVLVPFTGFESI